MNSVADIKKVCVVGAGAMGRQIAFGCAMHGYDTFCTDSYAPSLESAKKWEKDYIAGRIAKGKMTQEQADAISKKLLFVDTLEEAAKDADIVIEAIVEDVEVKKEFFKKLDKIVREDTLVVSNSSRIVSSTFVDCVSNPSRLANFHYFNPALVMELIEVVQGEHTSQTTIDILMDFAKKIGKDPVWLRKEIEGFIANRILSAISNEALYLVTEGISTPQEIDKALEKGLNYPMGPFRLGDLVGLDVTYLIKKRIYEVTGVKPIGIEIYEEKVKKGELGKKTGKGFYDYTK